MTVGILGDWDLRIKTPIGTLQTVYRFTGSDGAISATATSKSETVPLVDLQITETLDGQRVTWRQSVTKPMRLTLDFEVDVHGDRMSGHSRAGRLPRSAVTGVRRG
ncbi:hypothetical protein FHR72_001156 [Mycolicibacterium iranicum]|uniref:Cyclase n=1 Tax=Mycolicibacterium iranicum TaxID=912594 RepID=A0A839Q2P9_MYCIR|nr:hypothetical protein [Mycolicibacterium iranicum]